MRPLSNRINIRTKLNSGAFPQKIRNGRCLHDEFERIVRIGGEDDWQRNAVNILACSGIDLLAEVPHIDAQGAKGLYSSR